jgi:hydrogenase maturation protease
MPAESWWTPSGGNMARTLIIGYGNPLRGDDAVGFLAAERIRELVRDPEVEVLAVHQLTPELMEPISQADRVIFIDAAANGEPGVITETRIEGEVASSFTHIATPQALLAGAQRLYGRSPSATLITITGRDFDIGDWLSEPVRLALETLVQSRIWEIIANYPSPS